MLFSAIKNFAVASASFAILGSFMAEAVPAIEKANSGNHYALEQSCLVDVQIYGEQYRQFFEDKCAAEALKRKEAEVKSSTAILNIFKGA